MNKKGNGVGPSAQLNPPNVPNFRCPFPRHSANPKTESLLYPNSFPPNSRKLKTLEISPSLISQKRRAFLDRKLASFSQIPSHESIQSKAKTKVFNFPPPCPHLLHPLPPRVLPHRTIRAPILCHPITFRLQQRR